MVKWFSFTFSLAIWQKWVIPWMEDDPGLLAPELWAGRTIQHVQSARAMNVTGLLGIHWRTHTTDPTIRALFEAALYPALTVEQFYADWTEDAFGIDCGKLFVAIDSFALPRPCDWIVGPGSIVAQSFRASDYAFVDEFCRLESNGSDFQRENHRSWCEMFQFQRGLALTGAAYLHYNNSWTNYLASPSHSRALASLEARVALVAQWSEAGSHLLNYIDSPGDLGSVMNLQSLNAGYILDAPGAELAKALGMASLPPNATLGTSFPRKTQERIVVLTARDLLESGEDLVVKATWIGPSIVAGLVLKWRKANGKIHTTPMSQQGASNVFVSSLSAAQYGGHDFEYRVCLDDHCRMAWPPGSDWEYVAIAQ